MLHEHALSIAKAFADMPLPECTPSSQIRSDSMWKLVVQQPDVRKKLLQLADWRFKFSVIYNHIRDSLSLDITRKELALMLQDVLGQERYAKQYDNIHLRPRKSGKIKKSLEAQYEPSLDTEVKFDTEPLSEEENSLEDHDDYEQNDDKIDDEEDEEETHPYFYQ